MRRQRGLAGRPGCERARPIPRRRRRRADLDHLRAPQERCPAGTYRFQRFAGDCRQRVAFAVQQRCAQDRARQCRGRQRRGPVLRVDQHHRRGARRRRQPRIDRQSHRCRVGDRFTATEPRRVLGRQAARRQRAGARHGGELGAPALAGGGQRLAAARERRAEQQRAEQERKGERQSSGGRAGVHRQGHYRADLWKIRERRCKTRNRHCSLLGSRPERRIHGQTPWNGGPELLGRIPRWNRGKRRLF